MSDKEDTNRIVSNCQVNNCCCVNNYLVLTFPAMSKETFTTSEAAAELGVSSARVRQMVLDGSLPAEKFGHLLVISAEALKAARHRKTSPGPAPKAKPSPSSGQDGRVIATKKRGGKK